MMGCAPIGGVRRELIASRVSERGVLRCEESIWRGVLRCKGWS